MKMDGYRFGLDLELDLCSKRWLSVVLILIVDVIGSGVGLGGSEINLRYSYDERIHGNHFIRRENGQVDLNSQLDNITRLIDEVDRSCNTYCDDQTQYKNVCVNKGCAEWKIGLRDGCSSLCNESEGNYRESYACRRGCSRAIEDYYFNVTELLGVVDPPTLISGTLKSSSLRLSWEDVRGLPYLEFCVQKRFYRKTNGWETIPTQEPLNQTTYTLQSLKPFTEYQFRVGWILAHDFPPFYSIESNPIETHAKGLPNAPEITSIQPISNTSVAITWTPPTQPNGQLVAYILKLQKVPNGHAIIKEIPISQNPRGYTFSSLQPVTNYSLAISAQNLEGEGDAANIHFLTPQSSISNEVSKKPEPRLLLQGARDVYLQNLDLLMEPDVPVFASTFNISAMTAHFKYKWVFVATSDGEISRTSFDSRDNESIIIVSKDRLDLSIAFMSLDWLNNKLYFVGKKRRSSAWCIKRCDLNGDKLSTIYPYLNSKPIDFAADPFTGYLYWVSPPSYTLRGGLYKLDLISDEFTNPSVPQPVLEGPNLGPFTVDVPNYRILIVHKGRNTILSVSLDGDVSDIRGNSQNAQFEDVESLAYYNGLFYWTTGESVVIEEYNALQDSFYHNSFDVPKIHQPLNRLIIIHGDLQPTPVPLAPPQKVQVLFGNSRARVSWKAPPSISGLGDGAWQEWRYQIRVSDNRSITNISNNEFILNDLRPSTFYSVQVLAYSSSGRGPLSSANRGKTLRETQFNITLLWGSHSGLYSTNILGENVKLLTSSTTAPTTFPQGGNYISSLTWYESSVFYGLTNGSVFYYENNLDSHKPSKESPKVEIIKGISDAQSIAFDYIGQRLYWSNPKQQTIFRCGMNSVRPLTCGGTDGLPIITMASEIAIDSYKGLLLWTTGYSLEISRMNGYSHGTLFSTGLFSGVKIMGITLDTDQSRIYWISRSSMGSTLQRLSYNIRGAQRPMVIANYDEMTITGPIRYFNDRLIWLQGSSEAIITDLNGQGKSSLEISTISNITNLHVKDQSSLRYPGGMGNKNKLQVNPDSVFKWSVTISGKWNNFTIAWNPVNNTNYGKIFYEVTLNNSISKITAYANITVENSTIFKPYTEVEVSITALTYWSSAKATTCRLKTPSWKPSEPSNPRVFIQALSYPYTNSSSVNNVSVINAELRWDSPLEPNGLILGYLIHCWKDNQKTDCKSQVHSTKLSALIRDLSPTSEYHFAVQAYTDAGGGKFSKKVLGNTGFESPVPKLLITSNDKLEILDIDRNHLETVQLGYLHPISSDFLASDNSVFWFNEGQDLMQAIINSQTNKRRLLTLGGNSDASHLAVDWIGRKLYWASEMTKGGGGGESDLEFKYRIMTIDISPFGETGSVGKPRVVLTSKTAITSLAVNPFNNAIYWTSSKRNGITTLFTADYKTNFTTRPFLHRGDEEICNCSVLSSTGEPVALDPSGFASISPGVLFMDGSSIWISDQEGCKCLQLVNISMNGGGGGKSVVRPFDLAGDGGHVYWAGGYLYASEKNSHNNNGVTELVGRGVAQITSYGAKAQPYPEINCLIPRKMNPEEPLLFNHSSHSLHLNLPGAVTVNCTRERVSLPRNNYEVYYGTVDENGISKCTPTSPTYCRVVKTSEDMLHITDLHPYTTYTVFVTLTNYYAQKEGISPLVCAPIMLRTAPGAPMPPKLLRLERLSPKSIRVVWGQPEKLNGEKVWYAVHWKTSASASSPLTYKNQTWTEFGSRSNHNRTELDFDLDNLLTNTNYTIGVVAFSEKGDAFSESITKTISTFPNPNNISLVNATPHNLTLIWIPPNDTSILKHQIMYTDRWSSVWNYTELVEFTVPGRPYTFSIGNLRPKTKYVFQMKSWYIGDPTKVYIWPPEGSQFNFETLADKPGPPSVPIARGIGKSLYEISWDKADENGAVIERYSLECLIHSLNANNNNIENNSYANESTTINSKRSSRLKREWTADGTHKMENAQKFVSNENKSADSKLKQWFVVYNGTERRWEVEGLDLSTLYIFRVRAENSYGWGEYSDESGIVSLARLTLIAEPQSVGIIIGMISLAIVILAALGALFIYVYHRKLKEKPLVPGHVLSGERREVELATLRELPRRSTFVHQSNILYEGGGVLVDFDLIGVPKISLHQIEWTKNLGSGAFGQVFEGFVKNLSGLEDQQPTRVAIKTLRKGANQSEKLQFIEEAKLMSQFKHCHIIELLGICVDTDPCSLLLELMDGGDLLSYLRSNRPHLGSSTCLTLVDLLRMCVDVAKGCVYLENMHYVHRDLAARNCLISLTNEDDFSHSPQNAFRVVKIGDFGLTRDIYKNDYYRKDGGGLLPELAEAEKDRSLRWMAPESLIDGVFTTQTDVWAFGIVLWEIMTLGQQPYPARSNVEVLEYVRNGGRLQKPPHSPHPLGNLMIQCWEYSPENRPTFKDCLNQLELVVQNFEHVSTIDGIPQLSDIHFDPYSYSDGGSEGQSVQYVGANPPEVLDSVFIGEGAEESLESQHEIFNGGNRSQIPKYFEALSDSSGPSFTEKGYEIPLPKKPPRNTNHNKNNNNQGGSRVEMGLPSPSYWNAETLPIRNRLIQEGSRREYRNLLASSTSEEGGPLEQTHPTTQGGCTISEHHYLGNIGKGPTAHLKRVPCHMNNGDVGGDPSSVYNYHSYAAQSLNPPLGDFRSTGVNRINKNSQSSSSEESSSSFPSSPTEYSPFNPLGGLRGGSGGSHNNYISQYTSRPCVNGQCN